MLRPGVYPAAVTPLDEKGRIDMNGVAKLLAFFEASGCTGAVLAGTNGEGPSLSAVEKRDLLRDAKPLAGKLDLILGVATPSLDEAVWLSKRAAEFEAKAILLMAPSYFRAVSDNAIVEWFLEVIDRSPVPVIVYNFPKMTGITITPDMMEKVGEHANMAGCKDSSGEVSNLLGYRQALKRQDQSLFVGNEGLLIDALEAGWTGTISGAANVIGRWLSAIVREFYAGEHDSAMEKFHLAKPVIEQIRVGPQPAMNKMCLYKMGVLPRPDVRLPLEKVPEGAADELLHAVKSALGDPGSI